MQSIARMSKMVIVIYIVVEPFLFLIYFMRLLSECVGKG